MGNKRYTADETDQMKLGQARLQELEIENARLEGVVALLTVDKLMLQEAVEEYGRGSARKSHSGDRQ
jgi:hypothetical protein